MRFLREQEQACDALCALPTRRGASLLLSVVTEPCRCLRTQSPPEEHVPVAVPW